MNARITKSPYPEVLNGTIGEVIGTMDDGYAITIEGNFTVPAATPSMKPGKRDFFFQKNECELIREDGSPMAQEIVFMQSWQWLQKVSHANSVDKGFWNLSREIEATCASVSPSLANAAKKMRNSQLRDLMVSEIGEATEADRKDLMSDHIPGFTGVEEEFADLAIRLADYAAGRKLRISEAIIAKLAFNARRPAMHGGKLF